MQSYLDEGDYFSVLHSVHHHAATPGDQCQGTLGRETCCVACDDMLANAVGHQFTQSIHHKGMRTRVVQHYDGTVLQEIERTFSWRITRSTRTADHKTLMTRGDLVL